MSLSKAVLGGCVLLLLLPAQPGRAQAGACPKESLRAAAVRERIEQEWPLRQVDAVVEYIARFGRSLAQQAGFGRTARWRFAVVRDYSVNAYSIGDGIIYLTEGAILMAANEAELAAIIAHEMGHQLAGHFCSGTARLGEEKPWWEVLFSSTEAGPSAAPATVEEHFGSLRQGTDPTKEQEADRLATHILLTAGYDPAVRMELARRIARSQPTAGGRQSSGTGQGRSELRRMQELLRMDH